MLVIQNTIIVMVVIAMKDRATAVKKCVAVVAIM